MNTVTGVMWLQAQGHRPSIKDLFVDLIIHLPPLTHLIPQRTMHDQKNAGFITKFFLSQAVSPQQYSELHNSRSHSGSCLLGELLVRTEQPDSAQINNAVYHPCERYLHQSQEAQYFRVISCVVMGGEFSHLQLSKSVSRDKCGVLMDTDVSRSPVSSEQATSCSIYSLLQMASVYADNLAYVVLPCGTALSARV